MRPQENCLHQSPWPPPIYADAILAKNAPIIFPRTISVILSSLKLQSALVYLENIVLSLSVKPSMINKFTASGYWRHCKMPVWCSSWDIAPSLWRKSTTWATSYDPKDCKSQNQRLKRFKRCKIQHHRWNCDPFLASEMSFKGFCGTFRKLRYRETRNRRRANQNSFLNYP